MNADRMIGAYARTAGSPEPTAPLAKLGRIERMIAASRIRDNQRFLLVSALSIVVILLALGLLSREAAAPPAAELPTQTASPVPADPTIRAVLVALADVDVRAVADAEPTTYHLRGGETLALEAFQELRLTVADAGLVDVSLAGQDVTAGQAGAPHTYRFTLGDDEGEPGSTA
jgi:hypothetical protein